MTNGPRRAKTHSRNRTNTKSIILTKTSPVTTKKTIYPVISDDHAQSMDTLNRSQQVLEGVRDSKGLRPSYRCICTTTSSCCFLLFDATSAGSRAPSDM